MGVRNRHNDVVTDHELVSAAGERAREVQRAQGADEFAAGDRSPSRPSASSTYRLIIGNRSYRTTPRVTGLFPSRVPEHPDDGDSRSNQGGTVPAGAPVGIMGACDSALPRLASASRWFRSSGVLGSGRPACGIRSPRSPNAFDVSLFRHCPRPFARRMPHACLSRAPGISRATRTLGRLPGRRGCRR